MGFVREFVGFAGVRIEADDMGSADDPSIVLLPSPGQTRGAWLEVASALEQAGRHVINVDLRGAGGSGRPSDGRMDLEAHVQDLRAVLGQMRTRPVIVAAKEAGWVAMAALAEEAVTIAAGLVLIDLPVSPGFEPPHFIDEALPALLAEAAPRINIPALIISHAASDASLPDWLASLPDAEAVAAEPGEPLGDAERTEALNALLLDFLERKQPRSSAEYRSGSDARTLRDAMGCFATGVTIVTARNAEGQPIGLTANSFTSVSLDPPLLLVCVANSSGSAETLRAAEHFAVNVLQIGQQVVSNRFAGKAEDRFADTRWEEGEHGSPVLLGSLFVFECTRDGCHDAGDHFILVGRVEKASFEPRRDPLLYFRGKYRRLHFT
jgi:flavin reductase (DIM6/NTAB) family NADH-FMN oxidoreductase RutF